ncbi:hypothetical protein BJ742DRAFT_853521 [Cladochytrium replicatum]|nr:hypothetical protein BJ742DRAFT_853521 [Cladochytrium replicatum]
MLPWALLSLIKDRAISAVIGKPSTANRIATLQAKDYEAFRKSLDESSLYTQDLQLYKPSPLNQDFSDDDDEDFYPDNVSFVEESDPAETATLSSLTRARSRLSLRKSVQYYVPPRVFRLIALYLPSNKDRVKLLLVCSDWSRSAAEAIYQSPPLNDSTAFERLTGVLIRSGDANSGGATSSWAADSSTYHPYHVLVRELYLSGPAADELTIGDLDRAMAMCVNLVSFHLERCLHVSNIFIQSLSRYCPLLQRLELSGCTPLSDIFIPQLAEQCVHLEAIDLSYTNVTVAGTLPVLVEKCQYLISVNLSNCRPSVVASRLGGRRVSVTGGPLGLDESLNGMMLAVPNGVSGFIKITEDNESEPPNMSQSRNPPTSQRHLGVDRRRSRSALAHRTPDARSMSPGMRAESPLSPTVSSIWPTLDFSSTSFTRPYLRYLTLPETDVTDDLIRFVAVHAPNLEAVNIQGCMSVSDDGISWLARSCTRMLVLDLGGCMRITELAIQALALNAISESLEELCIAGCKHPTPSSIQRLAKQSARLQRIICDGCPRIVGSYVQRFAEPPRAVFKRKTETPPLPFAAGGVIDWNALAGTANRAQQPFPEWNDYDSSHSNTRGGRSRRRATDLAEFRKNTGVGGMAGSTTPDSTPTQTECTIEGRVNVLRLGDFQLPIAVPAAKPKQRPKPTSPEDEDYEDIDENFMEEARKNWVRAGSPSPRRVRRPSVDRTVRRSVVEPRRILRNEVVATPGAKPPWRPVGTKQTIAAAAASTASGSTAAKRKSKIVV